MLEINFVCSNFLCQHVQTSIGGVGVLAQFEFLALDNVQSFFL